MDEPLPPSRVVVADMDDKVQSDTLEAAQRIFAEQVAQGGNVKEIASALKTHLDGACGPKWHVVVGANFGSAVAALSKVRAHPTRRASTPPHPRAVQGFLHFYIGDVAFLVFKTA